MLLKIPLKTPRNEPQVESVRQQRKKLKALGDTDLPCSWTGGITYVKVSMLLETTYTLRANPIEILMAFFTELEKKNHHKIHKEVEKMQNDKVARSRSRSAGSITMAHLSNQSYTSQHWHLTGHKPRERSRQSRNQPRGYSPYLQEGF